MKPRLLQNTRFLPATEAALNAEFDVHPLWTEPDASAFFARRGAEFVGLVTSGAVGADAPMLATMPSLEVIASRGVGYDKIDVVAARAKGIVVSNTPDVLTDCVADHAFALVLCVARRLCVAERFVRDGEWVKGRFPMTTRVSGKRLGILGMGRIGSTVAKRASGFDMEVRYHNRRAIPGAAYAFEPSAEELARWADFLVVTAAGGPGTHKLVSASVLAALGSEGYLINVSRGTSVDEPALVEALVNRRIAGAALDVFENEPHVPPALLALDNVALFPHIASSTNETFRAMEDLVLDNLRSFFATGRLVTPIE
jgi:lactate dehydrogenase-like 2-hydroxyacid dehydrogenase